MRKVLIINLIAFFILLTLPSVSAAHFIVGVVNPALDGTSANGKTVVLWNPANGLGDNLTDIIGTSGNSGTDNIYLIDCELLNTPCVVGDEVRAQVFNSGDGYISTGFVNFTVTGAGFDTMSNLTLNSPPTFLNISVDDSFSVPSREIDLTPASTTGVICEGVIYEYDGNSSLSNVTGEFFDTSVSSYGNSDDNNSHYSNSSCSLDLSYGNAFEAFFSCGFQTEYYANSGNWNCTASATDNLSISNLGSNNTNINPLLALSIPSPIDFGEINASQVGPELEINVTNAGNMMINLSLSGYGATEGDGLAMNCTLGLVQNISIEYEKHNLTDSIQGALTLSEFEGNYTNLTSSPSVKKFNLNYRQNDSLNKAVNSTYWRIYVPAGVAGSCTGNIIFGAVQGPAA